jgi:hypothetical protein
LVVTGAVILAVTVINPGYKRDCAATMQEVARRGSVWASTHDDRFPSDFTFLSAERGYSFILPCLRNGTDNDQEAAQRSYQIVTPGVRSEDRTAVFMRCPNHEHSVRADGKIVADQPRS